LALPPVGLTAAFISPDLKIDPSIKSGHTVSLAVEVGAALVTLAANTCNASSVNAAPTRSAVKTRMTKAAQ
jgi:hypothetical protein